MRIVEVYPMETQSARWEVECNDRQYEVVLSEMDTTGMTDDERHKASGILRVSDDAFFTFRLTNFNIALSADPMLFALAIADFDRALANRLQAHE